MGRGGGDPFAPRLIRTAGLIREILSASEIVRRKQYGEKVAARGLTQNGKAMFELFVSESGSWTVIVSDPVGRSCIIASSEDWQRVPAIIGDPV